MPAPSTAARGPLGARGIAELLAEARARTLSLVEPVSDEDLLRQHDPLMSPIVWDLGHIGHFEEVWLLEQRHADEVTGEGLRGMYDPFTNPRATRDSLPLPTVRECRDYLARIRAAVLERLPALDLCAPSPLLREGFVFRMVLQHEYQHNETILQTLQLKRGAPYTPPHRHRTPSPVADAPEPGVMVRFPGGEVTLGTDDRSAAYDNERPAHRVRLDPFLIDVHPVTNGEYRGFVEAGGYQDRAAWSSAGWEWKEREGLRAPKYWARDGDAWTERSMDRTAPIDLLRPVCHVCYWEADAYARWARKRLPTEVEWEAAASWDPVAGKKLEHPWGEEAPTGAHANLDALLFETSRVGSYPPGVSPIGCWDMIGNVWEWTSSGFGAYPGYRTFPYPEYSEAFFGDDHKVLRGGSWATRFGAVRGTFRNWDYPIRRQIFSGFRCAADG